MSRIAWAAIVGVIAFAFPIFAVAQQPETPPVVSTEQSPAAPTVPNNDAATTPPGAADIPESKKTPSECKGLTEKPCRKNKICTWIIPKEADKTGQVPPAYCRKLGATKAKAKNADAPPTPPPGASSP